MRQLFLFLYLLCFATLALANDTSAPLYQVDMIVFARQDNPSHSIEHPQLPLVTPGYPKAVPLKPFDGETIPFHLLPTSSSTLGKEYWALKHKSHFQVLGFYSWLQPSDNKRPVTLPAIRQNGWDVEGMLQIRQRNYYLLNTELFFSSPGKQREKFIFSQKQRLKDDVVYYLDHPQAGMLIKIHKIV